MNQPTPSVAIEVLTDYSSQDAIDIGQLLPHLSDIFDGSPVSEHVLRDIIASPYHDQLVARNDQGRIVGTATITITMGAAVGRNAWLEDFVVDPTVQGAGIGSRLWDAMIDWCRKRSVHKLGFTSNPTRTAAHAFYLKRGAEIRDTSYFKKTID